MATALNRIRHVAFRSVAGVRPIRPSCPLRSAQSFSTTTFYRDEASQTPSSQSTFASTLIAEDRAEYDSLSPNERQEYEKIYRKLDAHMNSPDVQSRINAELSEAAQEVESAELPDDDFDIPKIRPGFMALGEAEEQETGEDEEFDGDDITSMGHSHLEQHREIRHYARIAAWEMPLLSKLAKPFTPPALDSPLRFRYTTYMGSQHPAEKKVVLEFTTSDLPHLSPPQRLKLIKLVGTRYNPQTDVVKMSCEMFETQAQNKRFLGDLVDTLTAEAKNYHASSEGALEGARDAFEDIPVDFRHVKWKRKLEFPEEWKLNESRRRQLETDRAESDRLEEEREWAGKILNGTEIIEKALKRAPVRDESQVLVERQHGKRGPGAKGKGPKRIYR